MANEVLCAAFRRERSQNGQKLSPLKSGLQKYIRRGETEKALWCAGELLSFRRAPEADRIAPILTNFRHRLMIIFLEDVGAAGLWARADGYNSRALAADSADDAAFASWVAMMAAAPKSRACSHARAVASLRRGEDLRVLAMACGNYPSIATLLTEHQRDPRFANEERWRGALVEALRERSPTAYLWAWAIATEGLPRAAPGGRKPVWQVFAALEAGCHPDLAALVPTARRWYKDLQNTQEAFLCWMVLVVAQVTDSDGDDIIVNTTDDDIAVDFANQGPRELDDYVYDIHVAPGQRAGGPGKGQGGLARFAEEGSLVVNESPRVNPVWKAFYNDRKRLDEWLEPLGPPASADVPPVRGEDHVENHLVENHLVENHHVEDTLPDDFIDGLIDIGGDNDDIVDINDITTETQYGFIARTQINTSQSKTDVYFAREPGTNKLVVVKGPFATRDPVDRAVAMTQWKVDNGLPAAACRAVALVPDRWPEGVPLGIRNRVDRATPSWFLVADSLIPDNDLPRRQHQSKVWPLTEVIDWDDPEMTDRHVWAPLKRWRTYSPREKTDYVLALLARYVVGVSDLADRNFMRAGGRLYSLDEDGRTPRVYIAGELRAGKSDLARAWADDHWDEIGAAVSAWEPPEGAETRWEEVKSREFVLALFTA